MKKILSLTVVLTLLVALLAGCGATATTAPAATTAAAVAEATTAATEAGLKVEDLKIGVVMKSFDEFQTALINGAVDQAVSMGVKKENIITLAPKNESDVVGQVQMIENCISQGVNILVLSAENPDTVNAPLMAASAKGIKIVMADTDAPKFEDPNKVTFIGTDNYAAAHDGAAAFLKTYAKAGDNIVILRGKLGDTNHDARTKGLSDAVTEAGMTVLDVQDANCEPDKAANIMENLITKYGDKINALLVTSDSMAVGGITSLKAANKLDQVAVCGFDGFQVSIQLVADGSEEMIIAQKPYWMGQEAVKNGVAALLEGKTFEKYIDPGIQIIDSSNYKEFLK
ncbi:MAG: sugar ABC transporter substrate-binding protein [Eubacteriales bacterium]|nr:sugar ABC transporter substrate-binding protein [Eubacteriales bacterium]